MILGIPIINLFFGIFCILITVLGFLAISYYTIGCINMILEIKDKIVK